ncbi:MAG: hypothetical protein Q9223_003885 [Gallowayella weberi]
MGTRGLKVWRFRKRYFAFYNGHDSYPEGFGQSLVNSIPTDPEEYRVWLEEKRQMVHKWDVQYEQYLSVPSHINEKQPKLESSPGDVLWTESDDEAPSLTSEDEPEPGLTKPEFLVEELSPSFIAPLNDVFIEWIYTFNLEQEVFSINNELHYYFRTIPRGRKWFGKWSETGFGSVSTILVLYCRARSRMTTLQV